MRTIVLLMLSCAFPIIALSQIQPDKAILEDYAHPAFLEKLNASAKKVIIHEQQRIYLVAATPEVFTRASNGFVVVKQLSPSYAIVRLNGSVPESLFQLMVPAGNAWKASPGLLNALKKGGGVQMIVAVRDVAAFKALFGKLIREYSNSVVVQVNSRAEAEALLAWDEVLFADLAQRVAKEELLISGFDLGTNSANMAHHYFPAITGEGLNASLKENRFDTADIDIKGRAFTDNFTSATGSGHASIMATMLAGAGNTFYQGKGVAWKATVRSASFTNLMPEPDSYYSGQRISVQNHSYGTGLENFYGADAAAYDATVINNPVLLHVFSSGNSGTATSTGPYAGIAGLSNLTGSFKMAKNILVVGAIDSIGNVEGPSSKGPAYDGRIKPELVAFGQDGSSGSAAIVSGISLLMQQAYQQQHHDSLPQAALVKAMLINTADDVGTAGPDFSSGYGNANAYEALRALLKSQYFSNSITQGNAQTFSLNVPAGIGTLKFTLAWTDPAAQANAVKALVNDLDMELVHVQSGQTWQPWVLSRFPHKDSLQLPAVRNRDTLNNVEQVTLNAPPAGDYIVTVRGSRVTGTQAYFVAYGADTLNKFEWRFPMAADPVEGGTRVLLRWAGLFSTSSSALLQYTLDGSNWQTISTGINPNQHYFRWNAPDTFSTALLRMTIAGNSYVTDTFVISKLINTQVGFNCSDSFLFTWNRPKGVSGFRIYRLGSKFLEPLAVTNDTFFLGSKNVVNSKHFTVAPIVKTKEGMKAYTFNYESQGIGCYFKSFLALLNGNKADLSVGLGSLYNVSKVIIQKLSGNAFVDIQTITNPSLQIAYSDAGLKQGVNTYRVALQLANGGVIYSHNEIVYYLENTDYLIYPNPVRAGNVFKIQQKEPVEIEVLVHDATGRLVQRGMYSDLVNPVNAAGLQKGLYVITIVKEGVKVFKGKVIIQ